MARTFHRKERLTAMSEINVTPLIDLAFALLIIFMITAPLLEQSIDIQLPTESPKAQQDIQVKPVVLAIDETGQFFWDGGSVSDAEMSNRLSNLAQQGDPPILQIQADSRIPYQRVVDLLDLVKREKLTKIRLETRSK